MSKLPKSIVRQSGVATLGLFCGLTVLHAQSHPLMAAATKTNTKNAGSATASSTVQPVRPFSLDVRNGVLTVDGFVGKAGLNYEVHEDFIYFTVPGVGTAIVAQSKFINAAPQKNAFHGNVLTIQVNGHTVELTSANALASNKGAEAWVAIDPLYGATRRFPEMGFGDSLQRPYVWPGSKASAAKDGDTSASAVAPALPSSLRPKMESASSYSVSIPPTVVPDGKHKN